MGETFSLFTDDICSLILVKLNDHNKYMLKNSCTELNILISKRYRGLCLTERSMLKNKSISYVNFFKNVYKETFETDNLIAIISTNDADFILSVLNSPGYIKLINDYWSIIEEYCDPNIILYLKLTKVSRLFDYLIYRSSDDIDDICKNNKLYEGVVKKTITYVKKISKNDAGIIPTNLKFLQYYEFGHRKLKYSYINKLTFVKKIEYVKYIITNSKLPRCSPEQEFTFNNIDSKYDSIIDSESESESESECVSYSLLRRYKDKIIETSDELVSLMLFPKYNEHVNDANPEVLMWLYDQGYSVPNIYEIAYCNNMIYFLRPEDNKHVHTKETLIHDASNNVFDMVNISKYTNLTEFSVSILYYLVIYNRFDLYRLSIFNNISICESIILLSKKISYENIMVFAQCYRKNYYCLDIEVYRSIPHDTSILKVYYKHFKIDILWLIKLHKKGMIWICYYYIDTIDYVRNNLLCFNKYLLYACNSNDIKLLKFIVKNKRYIEYYLLFKFCKLKTLVAIGVFNEDNCANSINYALAYGDEEIVNYVIDEIIDKKISRMNKFSLYCAYLNNSKLAQLILNKIYNSTIDLSMCLTYNIVENNTKIIALHNIKKLSYYKWVSSINFTINSHTIKNIIKSGNYIFLSHTYFTYKVCVSNKCLKFVLDLGDLDILDSLLKISNITFDNTIIVYMIRKKMNKTLMYLENNNKIIYPNNISDCLIGL